MTAVQTHTEIEVVVQKTAIHMLLQATCFAPTAMPRRVQDVRAISNGVTEDAWHADAAYVWSLVRQGRAVALPLREIATELISSGAVQLHTGGSASLPQFLVAPAAVRAAVDRCLS